MSSGKANIMELWRDMSILSLRITMDLEWSLMDVRR